MKITGETVWEHPLEAKQSSESDQKDFIDPRLVQQQQSFAHLDTTDRPTRRSFALSWMQEEQALYEEADDDEDTMAPSADTSSCSDPTTEQAATTEAVANTEEDTAHEVVKATSICADEPLSPESKRL